MQKLSPSRFSRNPYPIAIGTKGRHETEISLRTLGGLLNRQETFKS